MALGLPNPRVNPIGTLNETMKDSQRLPICGLTENEARLLIRDGIRAGVQRGEALAPAVEFQAYELAAIFVDEYDRRLQAECY